MTNQELAARIARDVMTLGNGERVDRLVATNSERGRAYTISTRLAPSGSSTVVHFREGEMTPAALGSLAQQMQTIVGGSPAIEEAKRKGQ